jgi:hypothetical protein
MGRWNGIKQDLHSAREVLRGNMLWNPLTQEYVHIQRTSSGDSPDLGSIAGRLAYAQELFRNGLIDADDYEEAKRIILSGI